METKDWIMLIVPLIAEGILFFVIHEIYYKRQLRNEKVDTHKADMLNKFKELLQKFYSAYLDIQLLDEKIAGRNVEFYEVWNPTHEAMQEVALLYISNATAVSCVKDSFSELVMKWNYINALLRNSREDNNDRISWECAVKFSEVYSEIDELIQKCLSDCEKHILNL